MKHLYLPLLLFFFLVIEGVALEFLPDALRNGEWLVVPHWVLVYLVMVAVFYDHDDSYYSVLYGIIFGVMIDIVYTNVLGIYMFIYAVTPYAVHGIKKMLHANFFVAAILTVVAVALADTGVHILYSFTEGTLLDIGGFLKRRLIPTIIANLVFFILIYPFTKGPLLKWQINMSERSNKFS